MQGNNWDLLLFVELFLNESTLGGLYLGRAAIRVLYTSILCTTQTNEKYFGKSSRLAPKLREDYGKRLKQFEALLVRNGKA